jgi:hypothetical protein
MSLFRYKGSAVCTMEFMFHGQRIRETTGTRSKTVAQKVEGKRRRQPEEGSAGIRKQQTPKLFSLDAQSWLDIKSVSLAPSFVKIASGSLGHLLPMFGEQLSSDIAATWRATRRRGWRAELRRNPSTSRLGLSARS